MKPIRTTLLLAAIAAAISIAPLASAEAHKRNRGGDVAAAFALGLFAGHLHHRHSVYPRYRYRECYGMALPHYEACQSRYHHYQGVPRQHYRSKYYWNDDGAGGRIYNGR